MAAGDRLVGVGHVADPAVYPAAGVRNPPSSLAYTIAFPPPRRFATGDAGAGRRPPHPSTCAANGRDPVRRGDRLERRGRARVDLDDPGALAVPDEVDAEQPAQAEGGGEVRADRRPPRGAARRSAAGSRGGATFPHQVNPRAPNARRPINCSLTPSSDGGAPVGDGRRRARHAGDARLHDVAGAQPPAAPRPHPPAAAAERRLGHPAARAVRCRRGLAAENVCG